MIQMQEHEGVRYWTFADSDRGLVGVDERRKEAELMARILRATKTSDDFGPLNQSVGGGFGSGLPFSGNPEAEKAIKKLVESGHLKPRGGAFVRTDKTDSHPSLKASKSRKERGRINPQQRGGDTKQGRVDIELGKIRDAARQARERLDRDVHEGKVRTQKEFDRRKEEIEMKRIKRTQGSDVRAERRESRRKQTPVRTARQNALQSALARNRRNRCPDGSHKDPKTGACKPI